MFISCTAHSPLPPAPPTQLTRELWCWNNRLLCAHSMRRTFLSAICSTRRLQQDFRIKLLRPARNGIHSLSPPTAPAPCQPVATPNEQFPLKGHYHFWEPTLAAVFGLVFGEQEERGVWERRRGRGRRVLAAAATVVSFVCYLAILYALLANFTTPLLPSSLNPLSPPSAALFTLSQLPLSLHCKLHSQLAFMFAFYASDYPPQPCQYSPFYQSQS